ncbi:beta-ketoacyl-ACP synthase III [Actinokineospora globicatena]|uniref:beta-ketoacyl-ACP synthase III n=1 Tax=Actinokineospora globicatena TaxID=103729 RepID=UPI0020A572F6|nr:beta-ketoacyl-ACP synthase III [Actinokineospora globicatena]MCP2303452.1 3-oxoacyl-[acyl-carrier-protein] synthase III (EC 2.3.1.41) [Actinokineospora globicatena]GLW79414.1 3-oxoacyl-[acyl-carrier-protein] synthase 3 protein 5 [Actinokineospora globicatena]GLW86176.1 3-oxoacyl-[acyl-carrier-protein] synthase 3 protein 5 [Actinokineospora globicatena]
MGDPVTVLGIGGYVPGVRVTNADLERHLDTTDEWITQRTGVRVRYRCAPGEATSDLAVEAGRRALRHAGRTAVDVVVVATTTPDHPIPGTAPAVAKRLGLGTVAAFDVQAVCSGFLYAAAVATSFVESGSATAVLVIGADAFSSVLDPTDRTTAVIFGDGAGAAVIGRGTAADGPGWGAFHLGSDGDAADLITVPGGGSRARSLPGQEFGAHLRMAGGTVFQAAVDAMASSCRSAMHSAGWYAHEVDHVVGHQANIRILRSVAHVLEVPESRVVVHLDRVGNTSAASIPLALTAASARLRPGDKILFTAFGGGTTWGAATLVWPSRLPATTVLGDNDD